MANESSSTELKQELTSVAPDTATASISAAADSAVTADTSTTVAAPDAFATTESFAVMDCSPTSLFPSTQCWPVARQLTEDCVSLEMRGGDRLCFAGQIIVEVVEGSITCLGATLDSSSGLVRYRLINLSG